MRALFALALLLAAAPLAAQERVLEFHSDIAISPRGELEVTERIAVQVEGREIRRGILRDLPTEYRDRLGNKVSVALEVQGVTRNGRAERYALEPLSNGTRIRIGSGAPLPHGPQAYEIRYRTTRQVGFFDTHDELYWNVNGNGWTFAFDRLSAQVRLPQAVPAKDLRLEAYTGQQGARGRAYEASAADGAASFRASAPLRPGEGMTIVVGFPKGIVAPPTLGERVGWLVKDNPGVAVGAAGYLLIVSFLALCWWLIGRDPRAGPAFPRYEAPRGYGPASVRYLDRKGYDDRCFAAALLGVCSRGYATVREKPPGYAVERTGKAVALAPDEEALAKLLFSDGPTFSFGAQFDPRMRALRASFAQHLAELPLAQLYSENIWPSACALIIGVIVLVWMFALGTSFAVIMICFLGLGLTIAIFGKLLASYSARGRKLQDEIDGLRLYLTVAERSDLARMRTPPPTKEEFSRMLPYAVALEVEKTWAERFVAALGAAGVAAAVSEYYGSYSATDFAAEGTRGIHGFTNSLENLGHTVAAAANPPGSSSGFSGSGGRSSGSGGASGGGGGGGGGSGW